MEKIAYFIKGTNTFIYKNKSRDYDVTSQVASFLYTKDILIVIVDNKEYGKADAKDIASYINAGYGSVYDNLKYYTKI